MRLFEFLRSFKNRGTRFECDIFVTLIKSFFEMVWEVQLAVREHFGSTFAGFKLLI